MLRDLPHEPTTTPAPGGTHRPVRMAVAFDGSEGAWRALARAIENAQDQGGSITLLGVVEEPAWWLTAWPTAHCAGALQDVRRDLRAQMRCHLAAARDEVPAAIELHTRLLHGRPADALAKACAGDAFDVLICGPRPAGRLWRRLRPGCTRALLCRSSVMVLAVPAPRT